MTTTTALQATLAAENATIYGYGVAAVHLKEPDRTYALSALAAHQLVRDRVTALLVAADVTPDAALPAYQIPTPVSGAATARALAGHLEQGCAGTLWDLVAATTARSATRALAVGWLTAAAERAMHWGAQQALPGQPA